jgi:hypothetical protein
MLRPIHAYLQEARDGSRDGFAATHPAPFLLVAPFAAQEDAHVRTLAARGGPTDGVRWVATLAKRPGSNAFTSMVTIGRARNNDVELTAATISKFHAYVMLEAAGHVLVDAGSSFGTFVHERRLVPRRERHVLRVGDGLRLGALTMTYLDAGALFDLLRRELGAGPAVERASA